MSSDPIFYPEQVGSYWQLIHKISEHEIEKDFTSDGITESMEVFGAWSLVTHGTWTGKLYLQRSSDFGKTWEDFRTYDSANDSNVFTSGTEEDDNIMYRLRMSNYAQSDTGTLRFCRALLENAEKTIQSINFDEYDDIVFIAKSIGTVVACTIKEKYNIPASLILFTPLNETLPYINCKNDILLIAAGDKDRYLDSKILSNQCEKESIACYIEPNVGHRMEVVGDLNRNLDIIPNVISRIGGVN